MSIKELSVYKVNPLGIVAGIVLMAIAIICLVVLSASTRLNSKPGSYDQGTCWNKVIDYDRGTSTNVYYWPDGCKGSKPRNDRFCTMALVVSPLFSYKLPSTYT